MRFLFVEGTLDISRRREYLAQRVGPLQIDSFTIPGTDVVLEIARPRDFDDLLDAAASDPEQNLPYWAEIWPSGVALASALLRAPELVHGRRVVELGCGLGVTAIAAIMVGANLTVTDFSEDAIALCLLNARANIGTEPEARQFNWRSPDRPFFDAVGRVPVVLAADALYEERDIEPLLKIIEAILAPDGLLLLAEPGRRPAATFLDALSTRGWSCRSERSTGPWPDPDDNRKGVVVGVHVLSRPRGNP